MIAILGMQRIIILTVLLAVNVLLAMAVFSHLGPEVVTKERELRGVRGVIASLSNDIGKMNEDYDILLQQKQEFEVLKGGGFFNDQERSQAEKILKQIQGVSGVTKAIARIQGGVIEESEPANKAGYILLKSPITIKLETLDDINVLHYLFLVDNYFPGHISVEKFTLERTGNVTNTVLRAISSNLHTPLVKADIQLMWRTMIPASEADKLNQAGNIR